MTQQIMPTKRGQVTLFVILALFIVAAVLLYLFFFRGGPTPFAVQSDNPEQLFYTCLSPTLEETVEQLGARGGSLDPTFSYLYDNEERSYLCYSSEYYQTCVVQQPLLIRHIETELTRALQQDISSCLQIVQQSLEDQGYTVRWGTGQTTIDLVPGEVRVMVSRPITYTKGETTQQLPSIDVMFPTQLYELATVAESIVDAESVYGDTEVTTYMDYYHNLRVQKLKQTDGTTIYDLSDRETGDAFVFASRSVAWPGGYAS